MNRVGLGFDAHRFDSARPLVLGGVTIPGSPGLAGYSDADIVSHAVADALLGAAGLGDLGTLFPPTERWRGASGLELLGVVAGRVAESGWVVSNVDVTVVCEHPRVAPWRAEMIARTAEALTIEPGALSIKATTTDGLGFTGRSEGAAAMAVVLLEDAGSRREPLRSHERE